MIDWTYPVIAVEKTTSPAPTNFVSHSMTPDEMPVKVCGVSLPGM